MELLSFIAEKPIKKHEKSPIKTFGFHGSRKPILGFCLEPCFSNHCKKNEDTALYTDMPCSIERSSFFREQFKCQAHKSLEVKECENNKNIYNITCVVKNVSENKDTCVVPDPSVEVKQLQIFVKQALAKHSKMYADDSHSESSSGTSSPFYDSDDEKEKGKKTKKIGFVNIPNEEINQLSQDAVHELQRTMDEIQTLPNQNQPKRIKIQTLKSKKLEDLRAQNKKVLEELVNVVPKLSQRNGTLPDRLFEFFYNDEDKIPAGITKDEHKAALEHVRNNMQPEESCDRYKLSLAECTAIVLYTGNGYKANLAALREIAPMTPQSLSFFGTLGRALSKLPEFRGITHRGANLPAKTLKRYVESEKLKEPMVITEPVSSTSHIENATLEKNLAAEDFKGFQQYGYRIIIQSIHGKKIESISLHPNEKEVLFPRNSKFLVEKIENKAGANYIYMKEVE